MKKQLYYLSCVLFTLACDTSEKREPDSQTKNYIAPVPTTPVVHPTKSSCSAVVRNKEIYNVTISIDTFEIGTGGVYTENGKWYVITASHLFPKGRTGYFSTTIKNDTFYVVRSAFSKDDGVIMELSSTRKKFEGFSLYKNDGSQKSGWTTEMMFKPGTGQKVSTLCGAQYEHIGYVVNEPDFQYAGLIIKKVSIPGESGTLFYDENGNVYVLSQQHIADDAQGYQAHGITKDEQLSLLRPIGFGITISETGVKTIVPW